MTYLTLCVTSLLGVAIGWTVRRWLQSARVKELEQDWRQARTMLQEHVAAATAAIRTEQGKVTQGLQLLGEARELQQRAQAKVRALTSDAERLDRLVGDLQTQVKSGAVDAEKARNRIAELESIVRHKTERVAELESLQAKMLAAESQLTEQDDDLKQIHGIGPVLEARLNEIGVRRFAQIAAWSDADIEQFRLLLPEFKGRRRWDRLVEGAREQQEKKYGRKAA